MNVNPGLRLGGYVLEVCIGSSESRQTYIAKGVRASGRAVIKLAPTFAAEELGRLRREFEVLCELDGGGVVQPLSFGISVPEQVGYLVLRAGGPSLATLLESSEGGKLRPDLALAAAWALAGALRTMHRHGWAHCDVKPGNVLFNHLGRAQLVDLEFALRVTPTQLGAPDAQGSFPGTVPFVAPEVWTSGKAALSPASDVWALGVTLYVMLTGVHPFGSEDLAEVSRRCQAEEWEPLPEDVPEPAREALAALLDKTPGQRPVDGAPELLERALRQVASPEEALAELGDRVQALPLFARLGLLPKAAEPAVEEEVEEPERRKTPRRVGVRWPSRMVSGRVFPLDVSVSGPALEVRSAGEVEVLAGGRAFPLDPERPVVQLVPRFPGCLVAPPQYAVDVSGRLERRRFWITPMIDGPLPEAALELRRAGRLLGEVPTPARVAGRIGVRALLALAVLVPSVGGLLAPRGIPRGTGVLAGVLCLLAAAVLHVHTRPTRSNAPTPT